MLTPETPAHAPLDCWVASWCPPRCDPGPEPGKGHHRAQQSRRSPSATPRLLSLRAGFHVRGWNSWEAESTVSPGSPPPPPVSAAASAPWGEGVEHVRWPGVHTPTQEPFGPGLLSLFSTPRPGRPLESLSQSVWLLCSNLSHPRVKSQVLRGLPGPHVLGPGAPLPPSLCCGLAGLRPAPQHTCLSGGSLLRHPCGSASHFLRVFVHGARFS